jgi:signal peptidase II
MISVLADQASKQAVTALLPPFRPLAVMPSLNFLLAYNSGISFSFLDGPNNWQLWPISLQSLPSVV